MTKGSSDLVGISESLERLEKENWGKLVWESPGPTLILTTCSGKHASLASPGVSQGLGFVSVEEKDFLMLSGKVLFLEISFKNFPLLPSLKRDREAKSSCHRESRTSKNPVTTRSQT